ncbi:D-2-hydroxyacid dehydrogenase family protein [Magnetospira sp. QH-2]|uniref:D-2-hydroxyacid dehydrogenase family protein n=1 Tax=Magnetospira sp. (strain QH-2) TaxID=1288970 RepID=UPI0003E810C7|nr:D-2-hydroxyacid dehydrogenase family protein [Magnetospira sp. QH-2]CCQ72553.1 putative D-isomer specific 2-hydroxyacid dehydrogenase [Magnetospira sp. QH-2]
MKIHILDDWFDTLRGLPCFSKLDGHDVTVWTDHVQDSEVLGERLQEAEAVVLFRERTQVSAGLLGRLPNLKLISQRGVYPHVDVAACSAHKVLFCSKQPKGGAPNYAAAELTWGLILAAMRQIPQQMAATKAGQWQIGVGKTLHGRILGLYGYGRIGKLVADYARAFGMEVLWWSSDEGRERAQADGETVAETRAAFFSGCDVISLHLRLKPTTRGLVTAEDLGQMRPDALLVNTSRAGLIAPHALVDALNEGRPGMAAIDVFDSEPMTDPNDPLLAHPNVICTPHIGFVTQDEFENQFADIFDQVVAYAEGAPIHMINPEVWQP